VALQQLDMHTTIRQDKMECNKSLLPMMQLQRGTKQGVLQWGELVGVT